MGVSMIERGLVTTDWVAPRIAHPRLRLVDGTWYLPNSGRDAAAKYAAARLPDAVYFNLDASSAGGSALPHMLPSASEYAARMSALGISDEADVVVYGGSGANLSAARAWWMFRVFGHQ